MLPVISHVRSLTCLTCSPRSCLHRFAAATERRHGELRIFTCLEKRPQRGSGKWYEGSQASSEAGTGL